MQSHAPDYQYHITYTVEPMLEVLWRADDIKDDTRYKVLFPITTPLMPRPPHHRDGKSHFLVKTLKIHLWRGGGSKPSPFCSSDTVTEDRVFSVHLGTFLHDVELRNITFSTGVFTPEECKARGFNVQKHSFPNGTKSFSLKVPFDADVVLKNVCELTSLQSMLIFSAFFGRECFQLTTFAICRILNPWLQSTPSLCSLGSLSYLNKWRSLTQWICRRLCRMLVSSFCFCSDCLIPRF